MVNSKANHGAGAGADHSQQHTMFDNKKHKAEVDTGAPKKEEVVETADDDGVPDFFPSQGVVPTIQSTPIPIEMMPEGKTYSYSPKDNVKKVANSKGSATHFVSLHPTAAPSGSPHHVRTETPTVTPTSKITEHHHHTVTPSSAPTSSNKPHSHTAAPTPTHRTKAPTKAAGKTMAPTKRKKQFDNGDQFRMIDSERLSDEPADPTPEPSLSDASNGTVVPDPSAPPMEYFLGNGTVPDPSAPPMAYFLGNGTEPEPPIGPPASMIASSAIGHSVPIANPIHENPVVIVLGASLFAVMGAFFYRRYKMRHGYTPIPTSEPNDDFSDQSARGASLGRARIDIPPIYDI
jgi:hypothetical protein